MSQRRLERHLVRPACFLCAIMVVLTPLGAVDAQLRLEYPPSTTALEVMPGEQVTTDDLSIQGVGEFSLGSLHLDHYVIAAHIALRFVMIGIDELPIETTPVEISCLARPLDPGFASYDCRGDGTGFQIPVGLDPGLYQLFSIHDYVSFFIQGPNSPTSRTTLEISQGGVELFRCERMIGRDGLILHRFCADTLTSFPVVELARLTVLDPKAELPDLTFGAQGLSVVGDAFAGGRAEVVAEVVNDGLSPTALTHAHVRLTDQPGSRVYSRRFFLLPSLAPGQSISLRAQLPIPIDAAPGNVFAEAELDLFDRVEERQENNNFEERQVFLTSVPACSFTDCSLSVTSGTAMSHFTVTAHPGPFGCEAPAGVLYTWFTRRAGATSWGTPVQSGPEDALDLAITPLNSVGVEVRAEMSSGAQSCTEETTIGAVTINL